MRLAEEANSPVAELPSGTGPDESPTITSTAQIITYLIEGARLLARTPLLQVRGTASLDPVEVGARQIDYTDLTVSPANRTVWAIESATFTPASGDDDGIQKRLDLNDAAYYRVHHPHAQVEATARPKRIYDAGTHCFLGPRPSTEGVLDLEVRLLPKDIASGDAIEDIPDDRLHHVISFGCWRVCKANAGAPFAAGLKLFEAEIAWAAPFLGLGA